jgi:hypothetical protein
MEKQEAVNFILQELGKNRPQADIAADLSARLGAPLETVSKFVAKVASQQPEVQETADPVSPPPTSQAFTTGLPDMPDASDAVAQAFLQGNVQDTKSTVKEDPERPFKENSELETVILNELGKNKRNSDIVMMVCEQTGLNWNQAQRIVARIESKNRKKLSARQNRILLPLIIAAIVFGVLLTASGVFEYYQSVQGFVQGNQIPDQVAIRDGFWAISVGSLMLLGGIAGLIIVLLKQFK